MSVSANHHYVPQCILRQFCIEGETLSYFSKRTAYKGVHDRNIKTVFKRRHQNSVLDDNGEYDDAIETFFSNNFDGPFGEFLTFTAPQITRRTNFSLDTELRRFLIQFFYNLTKRTPEFFSDEAIKKIFDEIIDDLDGQIPETRPDLLKDLENLKTDTRKRKELFHNARALTFRRQSGNVLGALWNLNVVFAIPNDSKKSFVVGSNPVVRMTNDGDSSILTGDVELWTPIRPDLALGLTVSGAEGTVMRLATDQVRHVNRAVLRNSQAIGGRSERLLCSLVRAASL